jgi:hypothetical protein
LLESSLLPTSSSHVQWLPETQVSLYILASSTGQQGCCSSPHRRSWSLPPISGRAAEGTVEDRS